MNILTIGKYKSVGKMTNLKSNISTGTEIDYYN